MGELCIYQASAHLLHTGYVRKVRLNADLLIVICSAVNQL